MKRFELEEKIQAVWSTKEDIEVVFRDVMENDTENANQTDRIANALLGIMTLHDMKCKELWDLFEQMVGSGDIE